MPKRRKRPPQFSESLWLVCSNCKLGFLRRASVQRVRNKHKDHRGEVVFCSKKCNGAWLGRQHGFGRKEVA